MDEQQLQQQIVQLVQAAMQGNQEATQQIQQIMQAAQQGDQQASLIAQMIQQVAQQMQQQQVQAAKFGAKLNYIRQLRGQCPEGYEMQYFKQGGKVCKQCVKVQKNGGQANKPKNVVDQFKCGKKVNKKSEGGMVRGSIKDALNKNKKSTDKIEPQRREYNDSTSNMGNNQPPILRDKGNLQSLQNRFKFGR